MNQDTAIMAFAEPYLRQPIVISRKALKMIIDNQ
jgi:hypothetical protein